MRKVIESIKMAKSLVAAIIMISSPSVFALGGGDWVNNGGGTAEKNVMYAYEKLGKYIQVCLKSEACKLDPKQKQMLAQIAYGLPQELASHNLHFSSERRSPGFFIIDGLVRVAKTGRAQGSPIYVNSDLLYSKNSSGGYNAVSVPEAVAILVHELGHHYSGASHEELDLLGVRVSLLLQQKFSSTPLIPWSSDISATIYSTDSINEFPEILLTVGQDVLNVSKIYEDTVRCFRVSVPIPILPLPDIDLVSKKPAGSLLYNVHWDKFKESDTKISVKMVGNVSNNCIYKTNIGIRNNDFKVSISFEANKVNGQWVFNPNSLGVNQFRDSWYKIIKLPLNPLMQ
ncbi:MAG: hypothetical protein ACKOX6_10300 [Bdellovibrio sp.]